MLDEEDIEKIKKLINQGKTNYITISEDVKKLFLEWR